jgi:hypothetical protein
MIDVLDLEQRIEYSWDQLLSTDSLLKKIVYYLALARFKFAMWISVNNLLSLSISPVPPSRSVAS